MIVLEYLLDISVRNMTENKVGDIKKKIITLDERLKEETEKTPKDKWLDELNEFEMKYNEVYV